MVQVAVPPNRARGASILRTIEDAIKHLRPLPPNTWEE